jgi:hypothetical protein
MEFQVLDLIAVWCVEATCNMKCGWVDFNPTINQSIHQSAKESPINKEARMVFRKTNQQTYEDAGKHTCRQNDVSRRFQYMAVRTVHRAAIL